MPSTSDIGTKPRQKDAGCIDQFKMLVGEIFPGVGGQSWNPANQLAVLFAL